MRGKCRVLSQLRLGIELLELLELLAKAGPYFSGSAGKIFGGLFWKSKGKAKKSKGKAKGRAKTPLNGAARTPPSPPTHTHPGVEWPVLLGRFPLRPSRGHTAVFFFFNLTSRFRTRAERKNGELKSAN